MPDNQSRNELEKTGLRDYDHRSLLTIPELFKSQNDFFLWYINNNVELMAGD